MAHSKDQTRSLVRADTSMTQWCKGHMQVQVCMIEAIVCHNWIYVQVCLLPIAS